MFALPRVFSSVVRACRDKPLTPLEPARTVASLIRFSRRLYVIYRRVLAGAFVATIPLLIMLFIGGRQIVRGIMEGAVKS